MQLLRVYKMENVQSKTKWKQKNQRSLDEDEKKGGKKNELLDINLLHLYI